MSCRIAKILDVQKIIYAIKNDMKRSIAFGHYTRYDEDEGDIQDIKYEDDEETRSCPASIIVCLCNLLNCENTISKKMRSAITIKEIAEMLVVAYPKQRHLYPLILTAVRSDSNTIAGEIWEEANSITSTKIKYCYVDELTKTLISLHKIRPPAVKRFWQDVSLSEKLELSHLTIKDSAPMLQYLYKIDSDLTNEIWCNINWDKFWEDFDSFPNKNYNDLLTLAELCKFGFGKKLKKEAPSELYKNIIDWLIDQHSDSTQKCIEENLDDFTIYF